MNKIGVMGGTFDPIHIGHLIAASEVLHAFGLDRVLFVPAGDPWQKSSETPPEDRMMMTALAVGSHPSFAASRLEVDRKGPTYTADTLEVLSDFYDGAQMLLIVGGDALLNLPTWRKLDRVRELAEVVAVSRPGSELSHFEQRDDLPTVHIHEMPRIAVSATEIRERVRQGRPIDFLVPAAVANYIRAHGLYIGTASERSA